MEEVQNEMRRMAQLIGAKSDQLPTVCRLQGGGRPNINLAEDGMLSYEAYERGIQIFCYTFTDLAELMHHTFQNVVPAMASAHAMEMDPTGEDFHKHFLSKKIELMSKINPEWGKRVEDEHNQAPY
ncbi:MAG: Imm63 family immunity protein [Marinoscillum sp.]